MYHEVHLFENILNAVICSLIERLHKQTNKLLMLVGKSDLTSKCCANRKRLATCSRMKRAVQWIGLSERATVFVEIFRRINPFESGPFSFITVEF